MNKNLKIMESFTEKNLPSLKVAVLGALELYMRDGIPKLELKGFNKPLVIGSGNAYSSGIMLFDNGYATFADENTYKKALASGNADSVIVCSASGSKHGGVLAKEAMKIGLPVHFITCTDNSEAEAYVGKQNTTVTHSNREPFTYNTSTYMGWLLSQTEENIEEIYNYINEIVEPILSNFDFTPYKGYLVILPDEFQGLKRMLDIKFIELFGRILGKDIRTFEDHKHATTVIPYEYELLIKFGEGELFYDGDVLSIPLPKNIDKGAMMAISYYTVGEIQEQLPDYFGQSIGNYINKINKTDFGKKMKVIV